MNPWLASALLLLSSAILTGYLFYKLSKVETEFRARLKMIDACLESLPQNLGNVVREGVAQIEASRQREKEEAAQRAAAYPIGMFVPTDEDAAALERDVQRADDRFVSSHGPTLRSSRRSRAWDARSNPESSKPPEKPSGLR